MHDPSSSPHSNSHGWRMPSPYEILQRIERQLGILEGRAESHHEAVQHHLDRQDQSLRAVTERVTALEARPLVELVDPPPPPSPWLITRWAQQAVDFTKAVAPLREWLLGAVLVALSIKGLLAPDEAKRLLLAVFGLPLK